MGPNSALSPKSESTECNLSLQMESLIARITSDFKTTMKTGGIKLGTLRLLRAALHNREIEKRSKGETCDLTDEDVLEVVMREIKKRREAMEMFAKGGREDSAAQEKAELAILEIYLPPQMSEEDAKKVITEAVKKTGAVTAKEFGKVMSEAMKALKGKADSSLISRLIKEQLGE